MCVSVFSAAFVPTNIERVTPEMLAETRPGRQVNIQYRPVLFKTGKCGQILVKRPNFKIANFFGGSLVT
jgi:hypothetical protein